MKIGNYLTLILAIIAFGVGGRSAYAISVSPMQVEMVSTGSRAHATVSVINTSAEPLPIEAVVQTMTLDEAGRARTGKAQDDFLIMPPQVMIQPGATQNFRIQWLGDPVLETSQSYYVFFNQVPVKPAKGKAAVQVVMSLGVMVNVAPPQGAPRLRVVATGTTTDPQGKRRATVTVENASKVHGLLPQTSLLLSSGTWSQTLPSGLLSDRIGTGLVQPGKRRTFVLPIDLPLGLGPLQARLDNDQK